MAIGPGAVSSVLSIVRGKKVEFPAPVIERSPNNLIKEARKAFDAELFISCLTLLVTIPDVCASLLGPDGCDGQRGWCAKYLGLPKKPVCNRIDRSRKQSRARINRTLTDLECSASFTTSDFSQLRNAVLHTESSVIDGSGAKYSPFHTIGVQVTDDAGRLVVSFGATSVPTPRELATGFEGCDDEVESDCAVRLNISLTGLLARMEAGVASFLEEYPDLDKERGKRDCLNWGIADLHTT